jgi:nicotinamidase-related amidase
MQTDYCIDATCKVAFEKGYDVTIISGTTTTVDNEYFKAEKLVCYFENAVWNNRFANVESIEEFKKNI